MKTEDVIESGEGDVNVIEEDDDNLSFNLGAVPDQVREVIPKGDYNCVISSLEYQRSQSSNKPMWSIVLDIEDGTFAGRKLYTNLSFSEKALSITKGSIKTFAPSLLEDPDFKPKAIADSGNLLGTHVKVRTKLEFYNGEKQTRVQRWMAPAQSATEFV